MTTPAGTVVRSNRMIARCRRPVPSTVIVVAPPLLVVGLISSSHESCPVAPGWSERRVDGPDVAACITSPGELAKSTFVAESGPAKSPAVVLFQYWTPGPADPSNPAPPLTLAFVSV